MTRYTPQWLQSGSYAASQDRRLLAALWPAAASSGCAVTVAGGMGLNVAPGQVAVPSQNNTGSTLCTSDATEAVSPPIAAAPPSGQNRIDLVICQPRGGDLDGGANNDFIFTSVTGTAAASPTVPATPAGAVALYQVFVPGAAAALVAGNLTDVRPWGLAVLGAQALPPPVTVGSTLQSFTAADTEVWVAKNGVYGGAWRKARDVLNGLYQRSAAFTMGAVAVLAHDSLVAGDPYGLYSTSSGRLTMPIAGVWRFDHQIAAASVLASAYLQAGVRHNGAATWTTNAMSGPSNGAGIVCATVFQRNFAATDYIDTMAMSSASVGAYGGGNTRFSFAYLGTG